MSKVLDILLLIVSLVNRLLAKVKADRRQVDREALHDCPADWFGDHFDGLHKDNITNETTETESDD